VSSQALEVLYGQGLGCFRVLKLCRKDIAENTLSAGYQEQRTAEFAPDYMSFFQKSDISAALGTVDLDADLRFARDIPGILSC